MKIMLITGGSRGIGAATALLAAANGYAIALNYNKNKTAADKVVHAINSNGGNAIAVQADVSMEAEVVRLFETADQQLGRLDCLVNNAGILEKQMRVEDITADRLNRIFAANITGQIICAREAIRRMSTKHSGKGGTIINVSSIAARLGAPDEYVDYAASKGAIDTFTIGLSKEVAAGRDPRECS